MKVGVSSSPEADAYRLVSSIGGKMARLYSEYGYYSEAFKKKKKIKLNTEQQTLQEVKLKVQQKISNHIGMI